LIFFDFFGFRNVFSLESVIPFGLGWRHNHFEFLLNENHWNI
jgi:hypothetical protein